jgi:hypothetical protein
VGVFTEQLLGQFIAASAARHRIQITSIDCRTTYCEIYATSADPQASEKFGESLMDALAQDGLDLSLNMATDGGFDNGVWMMHSRIDRNLKRSSR